MKTLFLLILLSLMLVVAIVGALWWAVGFGQYGNLKTSTESIPLDPDTPTRDTVSRGGTA